MVTSNSINVKPEILWFTVVSKLKQCDQSFPCLAGSCADFPTNGRLWPTNGIFCINLCNNPPACALEGGEKTSVAALAADFDSLALGAEPEGLRAGRGAVGGVAVPVGEDLPELSALPVVARAVGVAVDHPGAGGAGQPAVGLGGIGVGPVFGAGLRGVAGGAHGAGLQHAGSERLGQHLPLPLGVAHGGAKLLVGGVGGAELVAVGEEDALGLKREHDGVGQDLRAGGLLEPLAKQKVAVAVLHEQGAARVGVGAQRARDVVGAGGVFRCDGQRGGVEQIVADPGLEQVAQDEQGVGRAGGVG